MRCADGNRIDLYRRVSPGWKEPSAGTQYQEGEGFHAFSFLGKRIVVGLCGDLWFEKNAAEVKSLEPDLVFWPVYTDFECEKWNTSEKLEYAGWANTFCAKTLYVNSFCKDKKEEGYAKGGAAFFLDGKVEKEIPAGKEDVLLVEI